MSAIGKLRAQFAELGGDFDTVEKTLADKRGRVSDGYIRREDIELLVQLSGVDSVEFWTNRAMGQFDKNKDGYITSSEFYRGLPAEIGSGLKKPKSF